MKEVILLHEKDLKHGIDPEGVITHGSIKYGVIDAHSFNKCELILLKLNKGVIKVITSRHLIDLGKYNFK